MASYATRTERMRAPPTHAAKVSYARCRLRSERALLRSQLCLGEPQVIRPVPPGPLRDDLVRIVAAPDAAVVSGERLAHIVALVLEIKPQNRTPHADVGRDVHQVIAAHAELL